MDLPQTGGSWVRDPDTGALTRIDEAAEPPIAGETVADTTTEAGAPAEAEQPKRKMK